MPLVTKFGVYWFYWNNGRIIIDIEQIAALTVEEFMDKDTCSIWLKSKEIINIDREGYDKLAEMILGEKL